MFDVFTGQPAIVAGHPSVDLPDTDYAEELAAILNANDLKQRLSHGRSPEGLPDRSGINPVVLPIQDGSSDPNKQLLLIYRLRRS
ncbi:hypothetical protein [Mesorhizobium sp. L103C119B0]|uniref:hypothetical protein n=1 Tax=Mesorhizobium sp. L103C119B0 TaxID=1287085 RepID=UPI0018CB1859|nr:hypothetical protein [Mesorhizobium sp. L103C119B0]